MDLTSLIEVHHSRLPLHRLIVTVTLTFDLIFIGGQRTKFGDFSFSGFGFIVRTDRETDRQNHRHGSTLYSRDYRRREYVNLYIVRTPEALRYGSHSFYPANTPYLHLPRSIHQTAPLLASGSSHLITALLTP